MKINGLQAEIENEGEYVILKLKMHPADFVKFVQDCSKIKKQKTKNYENVLDIGERKSIFLASLAAFKNDNEGKYPKRIYNDFYKYWSESNGKKMKFEDQKFFEIPKRLATFWGNVKTEEKSAMWQLEKGKPKNN